MHVCKPDPIPKEIVDIKIEPVVGVETQVS
jgi:hypothetical protein